LRPDVVSPAPLKHEISMTTFRETINNDEHRDDVWECLWTYPNDPSIVPCCVSNPPVEMFEEQIGNSSIKISSGYMRSDSVQTKLDMSHAHEDPHPRVVKS
jgi:hypothetical protein